LAALLSHRTLEEAARAVGISPNAVLRWQQDPEFDAAFRKARRAAYGQTTARLHQASAPACTQRASRLLGSLPGLIFSVSYTTREPRGQEKDGESYCFVSRQDFEAMIARGEFLE